MDRKYRVLILEDDDADAALIEIEIRKSGMPCETVRAVSKADFEKKMDEFRADVVLFDYNIPGFDGMSVLVYLKAKYPQVCGICVSGVLGEDHAVEIMKMGAVDYVQKKYLDKVGPAISRALHEQQEKENRMKAEIEASAARQDNKAKSEFIANMSHELRTPLNSVIGFSEVLQDGVYGNLNEKQKAYVGFILMSGRKLLCLINDILDLSTIDAGKIKLEHIELNPYTIAKNVASMFVEHMEKNRISLSFDEKTDKNIMINADPKRLKQVFFNLIGNAVKFSNTDGTITVLISRINDGELEFCVKDKGIGIKQEDLEKLFKPFSQVKYNVNLKEAEGTGLGLVLTQKIIELHGGKIWAESVFGAGSNFKFTLPLTQKGA